MKSIIVSMIAAAGLMVAGSALAADMPPLAKKSNCTACHAIDKKVVGPAWMDVSKKYKGAATFKFGGKDYPLAEGLAMKVAKGGSGNWGSMPMPANAPAVKEADIQELVKFVLGLAQ
jgi:cytochrome c